MRKTMLVAVLGLALSGALNYAADQQPAGTQGQPAAAPPPGPAAAGQPPGPPGGGRRGGGPGFGGRAPEVGMNTRPPNGAGQKPAFEGQTRIAERKVSVAFDVVTLTEGLVNPWGLAFLPDGKMLVTERPGRLRVVSADGKQLSPPVSGIPMVDARNQGGLLDVALDPAFQKNGLVYLSFSEPREGGANNTALMRGRFVDGAQPALQNVEVIYHQVPSLNSQLHYGGRIAFRA